MSWLDAIKDPSSIKEEDGLRGTKRLDSSIKLIYNIAGNYLASQQPDINRTVKVLQDESLVEFIVVADLFMTPSAKFADVLLPAASFFEKWNLGRTWNSGDYFILSEKVVEDYFESQRKTALAHGNAHHTNLVEVIKL